MPDDALYFGVGVDPAAEMQAVTDTMQAHGFVVAQRVETPHFIAVALNSEEASALRIVSTRGVVLALDSGTQDNVLTLDPRTGSDLDGDTLADIVLVRAEATRTCLALARVHADGYLETVATDTTGLEGATCIEALRDVNDDDHIDALEPMHASELGFDASITVALTRVDDGSFALHPEDVSTYFADERARREALVMLAVDAANQHALMRLAFELAWLERITLADGDTSRIARAFDTAIGHLPLSPALSEQAQSARRRLLQREESLGATASVND
jgi:hypothetical protein